MTHVYRVDEDGTTVNEYPEHTLPHELARRFVRPRLDATVVERLATHADLRRHSNTLPRLSMAKLVRLGWIKR